MAPHFALSWPHPSPHLWKAHRVLVADVTTDVTCRRKPWPGAGILPLLVRYDRIWADAEMVLLAVSSYARWSRLTARSCTAHRVDSEGAVVPRRPHSASPSAMPSARSSVEVARITQSSNRRVTAIVSPQRARALPTVPTPIMSTSRAGKKS